MSLLLHRLLYFHFYPSVGLAPGCVSDTTDSFDRADSPAWRRRARRNRARARLLLTLSEQGTCLRGTTDRTHQRKKWSTLGLVVALTVVVISIIGSLTVTAGSATKSTKLLFPNQRGPGSREPSMLTLGHPSLSRPSRQLPNWRRHVPCR